jgi:uncharacterized membrane protein YbhN (UPF0104 family)
MQLGYFDKFQPALGKIKRILQNRWFRIVSQILIVSLSIIYLVWNYRDAGELLSKTRIDYGIIFIALILTLGAVFLGAIGWGFTLFAFDPKAAWKESLRTHLLSNLAKYIPGYAWQLVGKAYLTNKQGTPGVIVGIAMVAELAQLVLLGLGLSLAFIPPELVDQWLGFVHQLGLLIIRLTGIAILIAVPFLLYLIINRLPRTPAGFKIQFRMLLLASFSILIGWVLFGISFWMIARAIYPIPLGSLPGFMFTLAASIIIGLAIVIVPGSIGVRESIMVYLLSALSILSPIAVMIAIISRIVVTISEIAGYLIFQFLVYTRGNNKNARNR